MLIGDGGWQGTEFPVAMHGWPSVCTSLANSLSSFIRSSTSITSSTGGWKMAMLRILRTRESDHWHCSRTQSTSDLPNEHSLITMVGTLLKDIILLRLKAERWFGFCCVRNGWGRFWAVDLAPLFLLSALRVSTGVIGTPKWNPFLFRFLTRWYKLKYSVQTQANIQF